MPLSITAIVTPTPKYPTSSLPSVSVSEIVTAALADMFNTDSGDTQAAAVSGSLVYEIGTNVLARLGTPAGADVSADVLQIMNNTDLLPSTVIKNVQLDNFTFHMVDETDGFSPEVGLSITATRSIDGAAFGSCANAVAEIASGWYKITLAAADLNGDVIALNFAAAGARTRAFTLLTKATT